MVIQGQLPKVFLPMIGVLDGGVCGSHSQNTSPGSSAHSRGTAIVQAPSISPQTFYTRHRNLTQSF